ncbi:hypothetical protein Pcinc_022464 [Petrolisthes cinctipes]|uniref:Uncharacterized protein n=1 Tax=Petrolisthes cinctipes TaxID=88211 RepID=A0AAE1FF05_PETCI|nr:hypothetical protein Pcinc_022464 [Petrolisthes cinctipes]
MESRQQKLPFNQSASPCTLSPPTPSTLSNLTPSILSYPPLPPSHILPFPLLTHPAAFSVSTIHSTRPSPRHWHTIIRSRGGLASYPDPLRAKDQHSLTSNFISGPSRRHASSSSSQTSCIYIYCCSDPGVGKLGENIIGGLVIEPESC